MNPVVRFVVAGVFTIAVIPVIVIIAVSEDEASNIATALAACGTGTFPAGEGLEAGQEDFILATIRHQESTGDYTVQAAGSSASGAYQFTDPTWNNFQGYRSAHEAPPQVQDAKAREYLRSILEQTNGDWTLVPAMWYVGHVPEGDEWDQVPVPDAGNVLTIREYQTRWLTTYEQISNGQLPTEPTADCVVPSGPINAPGGVTLPLAGQAANVWSQPHHTYPAIDLMVPVGTPVYAWHAGTVRNVQTYNRNCYEAGAGDSCESTCGIGMTVVDATWPDVTWTYCHFDAIAAQEGDVVTAGQNVGQSGNTGRSGAPHLHLEIRVDGTQVCPQPLLEQIAATNQLLDPHGLPTSGCSF